MSDDNRTFEEIKAEQDALWAEENSKPAPPGYEEYVQELLKEGIEYCNRPDAVFHSNEEAKRIMENIGRNGAPWSGSLRRWRSFGQIRLSGKRLSSSTGTQNSIRPSRYGCL